MKQEVGNGFPRDLVLKGYAQPSNAKIQITRADANLYKWIFLRGLRKLSTERYLISGICLWIGAKNAVQDIKNTKMYRRCLKCPINKIQLPPPQKINIKFYKLFELLGVQVEERGLWNKLRFIII